MKIAPLQKHLKYIIITCIFSVSIYGQTTTKGPVFEKFGGVYKIENPDFKVDTTKNYYVVFDVGRSSKGHDTKNALIETAARFYNMHAQSGVPMKNLKVALVLHGEAVKDALSNKAYNSKYGVDNPNEALNIALLKTNIQIIVCGQSAAYNNVKREELIPEVQLSLSAMTALIQLQNQNYRLINF